MDIKKHAPGFTLAEVLIALALLGVIAAFAIPKMMQSIGETQKIAVFKEAYQTVYTVMDNCLTAGELESTDKLTQYFRNRVNAAKACLTDTSNSRTEGCLDATTPAINSEAAQPGFVLQNGAIVYGFEPCCPRIGASGTGWLDGEKANGFVIDWNGLKPPNKPGEDILWLSMCYGSSNVCVYYTTPQTQNRRTIVPFSRPDTYTATDITNNTRLFQAIMR